MKQTFPFLFLLIILVSTNMSAQKGNNGQDRVKQQTEQMIKNLELNEEQAKKVTEINERYAEEGKKIRNESSGDRESMRSSMKELNELRNAELKEILTKEQFDKHIEQQKQMREQRRKNRGKGNK